MKQKPGCFTVYRGITIFTYMKIIINYQQIPIKLTSRNGKLIPSNISQLKPPGLFRSWSRSRCSRCSRCLDQLCAAWGRCVFFFFGKKPEDVEKIGEKWEKDEEQGRCWDIWRRRIYIITMKWWMMMMMMMMMKHVQGWFPNPAIFWSSSQSLFVDICRHHL